MQASLRAGERQSSVARRFGLSDASLSRHLSGGHDSTQASTTPALRPEVVDQDEQQQPQVPPDPADELLEKLQQLRRITDAIVATSFKNEDFDVSVKAIRTASDLLRLAAELAGRLADKRVEIVVDLRMHGAFIGLSRTAADALAPWPDARAAFARALMAAQGASE